jgi:hypothetical protein
MYRSDEEKKEKAARRAAIASKSAIAESVDEKRFKILILGTFPSIVAFVC